MLHKFVDIEIDKNVHQQNCACARPPYVTKLCKPRLGHFFVDTLRFHIFVGMETNLQKLSRLINVNKIRMMPGGDIIIIIGLSFKVGNRCHHMFFFSGRKGETHVLQFISLSALKNSG